MYRAVIPNPEKKCRRAVKTPAPKVRRALRWYFKRLSLSNVGKIFVIWRLVSVEADKRLFMAVKKGFSVTEGGGNVRERNGIGDERSN